MIWTRIILFTKYHNFTFNELAGSKYQYQHSLFTKGVNALNGFLNAWPE